MENLPDVEHVKITPSAEKIIRANMAKMGWDYETALNVYECDKAIERGERVPFDLSKEDEKQAIKEAHKGKQMTAYKFTPRERKANPDKENTIALVAEYLAAAGYEKVEITNKSRQIAFSVGDKNFEFTLVEKRKPK